MPVKLFMKTIGKEQEIEVCGKKIIVKKLSLRQTIKIFNNLKKLPKEVTQMDQMKNEQILEQLPTIIASVIPMIAGTIAEVVEDEQVTEEFLLDECGLDDNLDLIKGLLEVNNLEKIFLGIKSIKGLTRGKK